MLVAISATSLCEVTESVPGIAAMEEKLNFCCSRTEGKMNSPRRSGLTTPAVEEGKRRESVARAGRSWFPHLLPSLLLPPVRGGSLAPGKADSRGPWLPLSIVLLTIPLPWITSTSSVPNSAPLKCYSDVFCFVSSSAHVLKELINRLSHCIPTRALAAVHHGPEVILQVTAFQISSPPYTFNLDLEKHDLAFCDCYK